jgi:hypothetical protein
MSDPSSVLYVIVLVAIAIFAFVVTPKLDRDRIREHIEGHGGKVIEILRVWGWGSRYDRAYKVSYATARGKRVTATCRTSMWRGVYWVNDRPPGLLAGENESDESSMSYVAGEPGPPEPVQCLSCGATIPANKVSCPQCGWSYRESAQSSSQNQ